MIEQQLQLEDGATQDTVTVKWKKLLSPGDRITLKDSPEPERWWTVKAAYELIRSIPRGWNNNI